MSEPKGWNAAGINDCPICAKQGLKTCSGGAHRNAMIEDKVIIPGNSPLPIPRATSEALCPRCNGENNSTSLGGDDKCFHCADCGYVHCAETAPAHKRWEDVKLPELNVNGQFMNSELRTIQKFVDEVNELIVDRKGLLAFIYKQRQEFLFRERQLLAALKEIKRLPAKWSEDSSLATWFPLTAERLARAEANVAQRDEEIAQWKVARPISEYHEDLGVCLWWIFPVCEPPYCGTPNDCDWPEYHTHFTRLTNEMCPEPKSELARLKGEK